MCGSGAKPTSVSVRHQINNVEDGDDVAIEVFDDITEFESITAKYSSGEYFVKVSSYTSNGDKPEKAVIYLSKDDARKLGYKLVDLGNGYKTEFNANTTNG